MAESFVRTFLLAAGAGPDGFGAEADVARQLDEILRDARAAWPTVAVPLEGYLTYLGEHLAACGARTLARWHTADLYLAYGCSLGAPAAIAELERCFLGQVGVFVSRVSHDPVFVDDLTQLLRDKLLVGAPPDRAKVCDYSGQGALGGWIRIVAVRTALNLRRGRSSEPLPEAEIELASLLPDQAHQALKGESQRAFAQALEAAMRAMPEDDRTLLRLHHLDGLTMDQLSGLVKMPRSTVARRLAKCRSELLSATRSHLAEHLELGDTEVDSLIRVAMSRLDLALSGLMK